MSDARDALRRPIIVITLALVFAAVGVEQYLVHCRAEALLYRDEPKVYHIIHGTTSPSRLCVTRAMLFGTILIVASAAGLVVRTLYWRNRFRKDA